MPCPVAFHLCGRKTLAVKVPDNPQLVFTEMLQYIFTSRAESPKATALMKGYLVASKQDLRASKILYRRHIFALATYHLQQCVEKATKAFVLGTGMATVEEVRDIGHDSLKGHLLYATKLSRFLPELGKIDPVLNLDLSKIEEMEAKRLEIARWSGAEVGGALSTFHAVDKALVSIVPQMVELALKVVLPQLKDIQGARGLKLGARDTRRIVRKAVPLLRAPQFLFVASLLTFPHEAFTRYPNGAIGPEDYNKSTGIVVHAPELMRGMDKAIRALWQLWM